MANVIDEFAPLLKENLFLSLSTADKDGKPWNTPTFFVYDSDFNLYWSSHPESQHSVNISIRPEVFLSIYDSKIAKKAIYIDATATLVDKVDEIVKILDLFNNRKGRLYASLEDFLGGTQKFYVAKPKQIWTNGSTKDKKGLFIKDYRIKI